ncbi:MAG TPA: putative zinc-binding metallopeptidase, partial [Pirellulales bacterium]|nr:putative zinc-binding metallopeptidase [Pirellulales bacterium]
GHDKGRITINIREADDAERERLRVVMGEAQRTLIGHFRHEIGHYYWDQLVKGRREDECRAVFGDHDHPTYAEALKRHYAEGPPADWTQSFISAYATMHPWEDFAETWGSYMDMAAALDTAENMGFGGVRDLFRADFAAMLSRYQELGIALNELNRTMGLVDLVPEVFVPPVVEKLCYVHRLVQAGRAENGALQAAAGQPPQLAGAAS